MCLSDPMFRPTKVHFEARPEKLALLALSVVSLVNISKNVAKSHSKTGFVLQLPYNTLHYIAPIYAIVACTLSLSFWNFFFLRVRKVIVGSRKECLVEACTPVLRPILDHPYENWESRGKHNHYNNKYCPAWVWSAFCPCIGTSTTVWFLMERVKLLLSICQKLKLVPYIKERITGSPIMAVFSLLKS